MEMDKKYVFGNGESIRIKIIRDKRKVRSVEGLVSIFSLSSMPFHCRARKCNTKAFKYDFMHVWKV